MSVLPPFELVRPQSLNEALQAVSADHIPYAGGTELLLAMRAGLLQPRTLVDLKRLVELTIIEQRGDELVIGGVATHRSVARSPKAMSVGGLCRMLEKVGNPRVRAAGTLGGNLCFAEPKSDVTTLLTGLEAAVELQSATSSRTVPMSEFILGPYTTVRSDEEILTSIRVPLVEGRRVAYEKFQTMERPTVGVAIVDEPDGSRRIVVGAVGGRPEVFELDPGDVAPGEQIASRVEVIPDLTGGERYKRHVTGRMIEKALCSVGAQR